MNEERKTRRYGILVESFYRLKSLHVGAVLKPGNFDVQDFTKFMQDRSIEFDEVKNCFKFVFVYDATNHWANSLTDLSGFAKAFDTICDQMDGWYPIGTSPTTAVVSSKADGSRQANHIRNKDQAAEIRREAEKSAGEPERPSDDARDMYTTPERKGLAEVREALAESAKDDK